jgi:hypothetical protein
MVQEPVRIACPLKVAVGPPLVNVKARIMLVTVETVAILNVVRVVPSGTVVPGAAATAGVEASGEHPRKSGILTL